MEPKVELRRNDSIHRKGDYRKARGIRQIWLERVYEEYAEKLMWLTVGLAFGLVLGIGLGRETKRE